MHKIAYTICCSFYVNHFVFVFFMFPVFSFVDPFIECMLVSKNIVAHFKNISKTLLVSFYDSLKIFPIVSHLICDMFRQKKILTFFDILSWKSLMVKVHEDKTKNYLRLWFKSSVKRNYPNYGLMLNLVDLLSGTGLRKSLKLVETKLRTLSTRAY